MSERLRYTGDRPVNVQTGNVGLVEPGGEFEVPDELVPRFLRRPDMEPAASAPQGTPPAPASPSPPTTPGDGQDPGSGSDDPAREDAPPATE